MTARVHTPGPGVTTLSDDALVTIVAASVREIAGVRLARPPAPRRVLGVDREVKLDPQELSVELWLAMPETAPLSDALAHLVRHVVSRTEQLSGVRLHGVRVIVDELLEPTRATLSVAPGLPVSGRAA